MNPVSSCRNCGNKCVARSIGPATSCGKKLLNRATSTNDLTTPLHLANNIGWHPGRVLDKHGWELASFGHGVNVTLGLPFIRTSVDHGTALDLAADPRRAASADPGSLYAAVDLAVALAGRRR